MNESPRRVVFVNALRFWFAANMIQRRCTFSLPTVVEGRNETTKRDKISRARYVVATPVVPTSGNMLDTWIVIGRFADGGCIG